MTDPRDTLGFVRNRLDRHSSEQPEEAVPAFDAPDARLVLICGDRIVLRGSTALIAPAEAAGLDGGTRIFLGHRDGQPVFAAAAPAVSCLAFSSASFFALSIFTRERNATGFQEPPAFIINAAKSRLKTPTV